MKKQKIKGMIRMLSRVVIEDYYDKGEVTLPFNGNPLILTGDNGSGKTTIIDIIYTTLIGHFEKLFKKQFSRITAYFTKNNKSLNQLMVEKKGNFLKIIYSFDNQNDIEIILSNDLKDNFRYYSHYTIDEILEFNLKTLKEKYQAREKFQFFDSIEELLEEENDISFLLDIRKSLLYFPTYRRIDLDLDSYFSATIGTNGKYIKRRFQSLQEELRESDKTLLQDRRVIGVGDKDIYDLFKSYSEKVNKFKSENLSKLLTSFVKYVIKEVSKNQTISFDDSNNITFNLKAPADSKDANEHLIGLAKLLDIGIQKDKITNYFDNKEKLREIMNNELNKVPSPKLGKSKKNDGNRDALVKILPYMFVSNTVEDRYILKLSSLYRDFQDRLNEILSPFHYFEKSMDFFFNGKLKIKLTTDNQIRIEKNQNEYPFENLSTGEKQLLTLFAYCGLELNNDFPSFVLIDEPELSLHVKWQVGLLQKLVKDNQIQLMVSTHSPYILDELYMDSTLKLGDISE